MSPRSQRSLDRLYKELYNNQTTKDWKQADETMRKIREIEKEEDDEEYLREEDTGPVGVTLAREG